jgi:hypothetical protein
VRHPAQARPDGASYLLGLSARAATTSQHGAPAPAPPAASDNIQHAYNQNFSCPLTPFENRVRAPVRAGEKAYKDAAHS